MIYFSSFIFHTVPARTLDPKLEKSLGFWELRTPCSAACGGKDRMQERLKVLLAPHTRVRCPCWRPQLPDACTVTDTYMIAIIYMSKNIQGPYSKCQYCMNDMYVFTDTQYNMYNMERERGRARVGKITCKEGKYLLIPTPCKLNEWISKWWALQKTKSVTTCAYLGSLRHLS